jgi:hypothetical protein
MSLCVRLDVVKAVRSTVDVVDEVHEFERNFVERDGRLKVPSARWILHLLCPNAEVGRHVEVSEMTPLMDLVVSPTFKSQPSLHEKS